MEVHESGHRPREEAFDLLTLPFDQYQRYTAVAQVAGAVRAALGKPRLRVLDVGSFAMTPNGDPMLPLAQFLPSDLAIVTDLVDSALPHYVRSSGARLPFHSGAFDLVITCDTLENVPPAERPAFVDELLRAASHCVMLIAPFYSEPARRADRVVRQHLIARNCAHRQLEEHFEHGLPSAEDLRALLAERGLAAIEFADGYLPHWLAMIMMQLAAGTSLAFLAHLNRFYNLHFSPDDRREPAYRRVFVIAKPDREGLLPAVSRAVEPLPADGFPRPEFDADLAGMLQQARRDGHARLASLETENERLQRVIQGYERGRFIRLMRRLHGRRERPLRRPHGC
jgi:hypothetical protein